MTSPEEDAKTQEQKRIVERFRELPQETIVTFLWMVEDLLKEGSFGLNLIENIQCIKQTIREIKQNNAISS
jgi:hypothetical protein